MNAHSLSAKDFQTQLLEVLKRHNLSASSDYVPAVLFHELRARQGLDEDIWEIGGRIGVPNRLHVFDVLHITRAIGTIVELWYENHSLDYEDQWSFLYGLVDRLLATSEIAGQHGHWGSQRYWGDIPIPASVAAQHVMWHVLFAAATEPGDYPAYQADPELVRRTLLNAFAFPGEELFAVEGLGHYGDAVEVWAPYLHDFAHLFDGAWPVPFEAEMASFWNRYGKASFIRRLQDASVQELTALHQAIIDAYSDIAAPYASIEIAQEKAFESAFERFVEGLANSGFFNAEQLRCFLLGALALYGTWEDEFILPYAQAVQAFGATLGGTSSEAAPLRVLDEFVEYVQEFGISTPEGVAFDYISRVLREEHPDDTALLLYHTWLRSINGDRDVVHSVQELYSELRYMLEMDFSAEYWLDVMATLGEFEHHNGFLLEWQHSDSVVVYSLPCWVDNVGQRNRVAQALMPCVGANAGDVTNCFVDALRTLGADDYIVGFREWLMSGQRLVDFVSTAKTSQHEDAQRLRALFNSMNRYDSRCIPAEQWRFDAVMRGQDD